MKINSLAVLLVSFSIVFLGCDLESQTEEAMTNKDKITQDMSIEKNNSMMENENAMMKDNSAMIEKSGYTGKILAGTASPYIIFSKDDYENALRENKKILLYFYASWCPICQKEQPEVFDAFSELNDSNLVGFRVNYRDGDDDADEKALAKQFGVAYQHTKVILKDGKQLAKYPDSWDKQRYFDELAKV